MEIKTIKVGKILTNCFLLSSNEELAVIDPGDNAGEILKETKKSGKTLKYIILTHSHFDHVLAALEIKESTKAKILAHEIEQYSLNFKLDILVKEGEKIKIGADNLVVIHTPGHTPGGICLIGDGVIFTGDTLFKTGVGRTDLPGGSSEHLKISLQKISKILKPGVRIYPGHGEIFEYQE